MTAASRLRPGMRVRWQGTPRVVLSVTGHGDRLLAVAFEDGSLVTVAPGTIFETYRQAGS